MIDECNDVLVILPPNSLERCVNEDDWMRLEVAYAIRQGKNIIPIMMKGFEWGKNDHGEKEPHFILGGF